MSKYGHRSIDWFEAIVNKLGGEAQAERFLRSELVVKDVRPALSIAVDYNMSLEDMIAAGRYDWANGDITKERFPIKGKGVKEFAVTLVHFGHFMSSDNAVKEMKKKWLRPATHDELLSFGAKYPDMQREFLIVALGFSALMYDARFVLYLIKGCSGRHLNFGLWGDGWNGDCRFLAIHD